MTGKDTVRLAFAFILLTTLLSATGVAALHGSGGRSSGRGYFMLGVTMVDLDDFNGRLREKGYPTFSDHLFSFGGGGHATISRVVLGGEGHGFITKEVSSGGRTNSLACGYGFFDCGYVVHSRGDFDVYPLLGVGGGVASLRIAEEGTPSFDDVLDDPGRSAELVTGGLLVNLAVGSEYLLRLGGEKKRASGLLFGLRIGYTFSPLRGDWQFEGRTIAGGPDLSITGPYIRLIIGGGS